MALWSVQMLEQDSGVSRYTWRLWLRQRRLPCVRLGSRVLVEESDYRAFISMNRMAATGSRPMPRVADVRPPSSRRA
jgi:hypothetical protein